MTLLEHETILLPDVIAEAVVSELEYGLDCDLGGRGSPAIPWLAAYADRVYRAGKPKKSWFYRKIRYGRGNVPRDQLYVFMRHWLSGWVKENRPDLYPRVPYNFKVGKEILPAARFKGTAWVERNPAVRYEIQHGTRRLAVVRDVWRSWAGRRFYRGKEYHGPVYLLGTGWYVGPEQARVCKCKKCRGAARPNPEQRPLPPGLLGMGVRRWTVTAKTSVGGKTYSIVATDRQSALRKFWTLYGKPYVGTNDPEFRVSVRQSESNPAVQARNPVPTRLYAVDDKFYEWGTGRVAGGPETPEVVTCFADGAAARDRDRSAVGSARLWTWVENGERAWSSSRPGRGRARLRAAWAGA